MSSDTDSLEKSSTEGHHLCWSCREEVGEGPFCHSCVKIQKLGQGRDENYFSIFGLDLSYEIDLKRLREKLHELSKKLHPDFYSTASEIEKTYARDNSALINKGFATLSDPIKRADYLLGLTQGNIASNPKPPQELFEKILEAGELLMDQIDPESPELKTLVTIDQKFGAYNDSLLASLSELFENFLESDEEKRTAIVTCLDNIKYLRTITKRIRAKLDEVI